MEKSTTIDNLIPSEFNVLNANHLIIVCCHAIYLGGAVNGVDESEWGATKQPVTPLSEAQSYLNCARANNYFDIPVPSQKVTIEDQAVDSYQNLLFSLLRFKDLIGHYPQHVTVVSHAFKRRRFLELHASAIRWPLERLSYVGVDPPEEITPRRVLEEREERDGFGRWVGDLYGVGEALRGKRLGRGWRGCYRGEVDEDVKGLLEWGGGETGRERYAGRLPWIE